MSDVSVGRSPYPPTREERAERKQKRILPWQLRSPVLSVDQSPSRPIHLPFSSFSFLLACRTSTYTRHGTEQTRPQGPASFPFLCPHSEPETRHSLLGWTHNELVPFGQIALVLSANRRPPSQGYMSALMKIKEKLVRPWRARRGPSKFTTLPRALRTQ